MWLSVDPLSDKYPDQSPYSYVGNRPIMVIDPNGMNEWHPTGDGYLEADAGDNAQTLQTYLNEIGVDYSLGDMSGWTQDISNYESDYGEIGQGFRIKSESGQFDNLVGTYLSTMSQKNEKFGITTFKGNNCSPTTFNRVDKAMEFVYGRDVLGSMSWSNRKYQAWQGKGGLFGTGVISTMGYGVLVNQNEIYNGGLEPGAVLRLQQRPGPGSLPVSWHAVIFLNYTYDNNGKITGMTYWQQAGKLKNTINFSYKNNGVYSFSKGYKPTLGVNFE